MDVDQALPSRLKLWLFHITTLALLSGIILSIVSWMRICSTECAESHNWCLYGCSFETIGLLFFIPLLVIHLISQKYPDLSLAAGLLLAGALGAEVKFILVQKFQIGIWCPLCLTIAACVAIASLCYGIVYVAELNVLSKQSSKGEFMNSIWKGIAGISVFIIGFLVALAGLGKQDKIGAAENTIKESLFFGDKSSPLEVYIFTDWSCAACRHLEPAFEKMGPDLMKKGKLTFVDFVIHTETLNYSPYNVSFMIKNKPEYFKLREALTDLSVTTPAPTDEQIEKLAEKAGVKYQQLNFADIALSQKYFEQLGKQFGVTKTPTVVVINSKTKKGKKLVGGLEISEENIMKALNTLKE